MIHADDDVAVALRDRARGESLRVRRRRRWCCGIEVREPIPLGHKVALHRLATGALVRKYGECIGVATADIHEGVHVHVHNIVSRRLARGVNFAS